MSTPDTPELTPRAKIVLERLKQARMVAEIALTGAPTVEQVIAVYDRIVGRTDA